MEAHLVIVDETGPAITGDVLAQARPNAPLDVVDVKVAHGRHVTAHHGIDVAAQRVEQAAVGVQTDLVARTRTRATLPRSLTG